MRLAEKFPLDMEPAILAEARDMNICMITGIFPPDIGGPATYVSRLAQALHQQGHAVRVVTLGENAPALPFPVTRISRAYPLPLRLVILFFALLRHGWRSEVWYVNGLELPAVLAGKILRKRMIMKIVGDYAWERAMNNRLTTAAIDDFQQQRQVWQVELHKRLRAWLARQVNTVITPSQYLQRLVGGWGVPAERIRVIYNAVEDVPADLGEKTAIRQQLGLSENDRLIITVGRLVSWKGIDHLLRALAQLDASVYLAIIGDGPEKNKLTELAGLSNVTSRVKFLGKAGRPAVLRYVHAADLFVLYTGYEGFSHVLLEAMLVGTPVMTTPVCGNPELVAHNENGWFVPYGNFAELAKQICTVLNDQSLRERLREGGRLTAQRFTWEQLIRKTMELLVRD